MSGLLELAESCLRIEFPDRELDADVWLFIGTVPSTATRCKGGFVIDGKPMAAPRFTGSIDAALTTLYPDFPWLHPVIDYAERTVRLVNGIGLPVAGRDYLSQGQIMAATLTAAALRARAAQ